MSMPLASEMQDVSRNDGNLQMFAKIIEFF